MTNTTLEERIHEEPLVLPPNPFLDGLLTFSRDELSSGVINTLANTVGGVFLRGKHDAILSAIGLTVEKIGLFAWYMKEAVELYRSTPEDERQNRWKYFKDVFRNGLPSLVKDVTCHDPIDYAAMYLGVTNFPETPTIMISLTSFVSSVLLTSVLEVGINEARHHYFGRKMEKAGFGKESYIESRFFIESENQREKVLESLRTEFGLGETNEWTYHDTYYKNTLKGLNGRTPSMRLRSRVSNADGSEMNTAQIVYTRAAEERQRNKWGGQRKVEPYRYFSTAKEKYYFMLDEDKPQDIAQIHNPGVRDFLMKHANGDPHRVNFVRRYARNPELLVSVDEIQGQRPFYVLELKVHRDKDLLRQAMRHVMKNYHPLPTTHGKLVLAEMNNT